MNHTTKLILLIIFVLAAIALLTWVGKQGLKPKYVSIAQVEKTPDPWRIYGRDDRPYIWQSQ